MCFFNKKSKRVNPQVLKEQYLLKFESVRNLAKEDESLFSEIEVVRDKFEQLTQSKNKDVLALDQKMYDLIDDLDDIMRKSTKKTNLVHNKLNEIQNIIIERKYLTKEMDPNPETDFEISDGVLVKYLGNGGNVIIPRSIKEIGAKAFYSNESIKSITLLDGVNSIGESAFSMCNGLSTVSLPSSLTNIEQSAFYNCKALNWVEFEEGISHINYYAFAKCPNLRINRIPSTLVEIKDKAFEGCDELQSGAKKAIKRRNKKAI